MTTVPAAPRRAEPLGWPRLVSRTLGELLVTAGVLVLLFAGYELYGTNLATDHAQTALDHTLTKTWAAQPVSPGAPDPTSFPVGTGTAKIYLPTLGKDQDHVVVEGVAHDDLAKGPGHIPGTALPGQVGNDVISGHRTTHGAPFNRLDQLRVGDPIVLETRGYWFTYRMVTQQIVAPTDVSVTLPVPGEPGARPTARMLTLTTCNPKYSATQRLIVHAVLGSVLAKAPGVRPPSVLSGS